MRHSTNVHRLSRYLCHYNKAFAFSVIAYPHLVNNICTLPPLLNKKKIKSTIRAYQVSLDIQRDDLVSAYFSEGIVDCVFLTLKRISIPLTIFGSSVSMLFHLSRVTKIKAVQIFYTYHRFKHPNHLALTVLSDASQHLLIGLHLSSGLSTRPLPVTHPRIEN